ncbi:MAG: DnaB-like helicase C-terminal domain-containing protein [Gammaproteobacteria bacterium]|nr:DnaB-like helicase C-terminal domain-containing protein [Gammaproteobacteria bacterium]MDH5730408.1 DnaB-like helicase C-terminal domain-containing protein [Gammaproteobacteria bacterium]
MIDNKELSDTFSLLMDRPTLTVLAGRPNSGKTHMALELYANLLSNRDYSRPLIFFSMSETQELVKRKIASVMFGLDPLSIQRKQLEEAEKFRLKTAVDHFTRQPLIVEDQPSQTPREILSKLRDYKDTHGEIGLVVIDYFQLLIMPSFDFNHDNRATESEKNRFLSELKSLMHELNFSVLLLSQVNRFVEQRDNKRPTFTDLRDHKVIEQNADVVAILFREFLYNNNAAEDDIEVDFPISGSIQMPS